MHRIGLAFEFEAGHWLTKVPEDHTCRRPHGHNYVVEVECEASELDHRDFVVDYFDLGVVKAWVDAHWDHRMLNDVVSYNPTVELLSKDLFLRFKRKIPHLAKITIKETPSTFASYYDGVA